MSAEGPVTIRVASTSKHKIEAVEAAAKAVFPNRQIRIHGVKAPSEIDEQPIGGEMTILGARNRLAAALEGITDEDHIDYVVSMESGLFGGPKRFIDKAVVIVRSLPRGRERVFVSSGVVFPNTAVDEARKRGFATVTAGSIIAEQNPNVDGTDPHSFLTKGRMTRKAQLTRAVVRALRGTK